MRATSRFILRGLLHSFIVASALAAGCPTAKAESLQNPEDLGVFRQHTLSDDTVVQSSHLLPGALSAELEPNTHVVGSGWAGYDGASSNPVAGATAEAWILPRLSLMAGFGSTTQPGDVRLRAEGGVRFMVLDQAHHGIHAALGFTYRQDRFANEDGTLEWTALFSRRFGATLALARLLYAQDGEGDDREGELRVAGLHTVSTRFHVGVDGRVRTSLGSSDPHRAEHANPNLEFNAGPMVAFSIDRWAIMAEGGLSGLKIDQLRMGALVLGGLAAAF